MMRNDAFNSSCSVSPYGNAVQCVDGTENLLARDAMQYGVLSVGQEAPVHEAITMLVEREISALPVTHEGRLIGMLSEKDLLRLLYETSYLPGLVKDYMTCDVVSFDIETPLSVIQKQLVERPFRRVPILLQGRLAGMITRADLVRVYKERFRPAGDTSDEGDDAATLARDVMTHGLLTIRPDAPLYDAMNLIARHRITGLPVVDDRQNLLGIITEKDLIDCAARPEAVNALVEAYMVRDVITFSPETKVRRICACLIENDFHRVPIVDGTRLVGIISRSDILKHRAATFKY
jgi:CBS domain-containing protein